MYWSLEIDNKRSTSFGDCICAISFILLILRHSVSPRFLPSKICGRKCNMMVKIDS